MDRLTEGGNTEYDFILGEEYGRNHLPREAQSS